MLLRIYIHTAALSHMFQISRLKIANECFLYVLVKDIKIKLKQTNDTHLFEPNILMFQTTSDFTSDSVCTQGQKQS